MDQLDQVTLFDPNDLKNKAEIKKQMLAERIVFDPVNQAPLP
jgi:hypothetical protein